MKEELLEVMTKRKGKVLKVALDIFNKVQSQNVTTFKINDIQDFVGKNENEEVLKNNMDELIQKFELLLENPRSPLLSALKNLAQYKGDKGVLSFNRLYNDQTMD